MEKIKNWPKRIIAAIRGKKYSDYENKIYHVNWDGSLSVNDRKTKGTIAAKH